MIFNRNQNGQASKEPNKAASVDEDVTTVDWMIMTDIGTRIGKIPKSKPESKLESKPESKSEFKQTTKQEPNKVSPIAAPSQLSSNQSADDDREDIEWLQSLDLDKPIERSVPTKKNIGNNQQSTTNDANNDVEKIDWLIVSDLKTKKIDSGFNNTNSPASSPASSPANSQSIIPDHTVLQVYPPSEIQTNVFAAPNLENDFGDLGLDDLDLDDDLGDLQFDDLDEVRLNELISGIGVTDGKLQELSELMDDEFSLHDYAENGSEHELDTILGISKVISPNSGFGIANNSLEMSTELPEVFVDNDEFDRDKIDFISEQQYSPLEQDHAQEYLVDEVEQFDDFEKDLILEESSTDEFNNLEGDFTGLQEDLGHEFDYLAEYPVDDLAEYPISGYSVDDLGEYPVAGYPVDDLAEYPVDDLAEYPVDDLAEYPVAGYPVDDLAGYPSEEYLADDQLGYSSYQTNDLQDDLALSDEIEDDYLIDNISVTTEFQADQDVFVGDNFNSLNDAEEIGNGEISASDIGVTFDDGFGEMRSPVVLDASLIGDEIWTSSPIASSEAMNGANFDSNFENAFASDWSKVPQGDSHDVTNDHVWDSSANINPEVLSADAIDNAFGSVDDWAIASNSLPADSIQSESLDLPVNVGFELPIDLPIDLPAEEQFLQGFEDDLEISSKSMAKSPFTEQEYLELQEYDRIFATEEVTPEITLENSAEFAIASNPNAQIAVEIDYESTHLQPEIDSEVDDLGWNPDSEEQLLAELDAVVVESAVTDYDDYAEWQSELQHDIISDGASNSANDRNLDWNVESEEDEPLLEPALDDYPDWNNELQSEIDNDTSWQDDLDSLIDSEQYLDDFDVISDEIPEVVVSAATLLGNSHNNDDLFVPDHLEDYIDSASDLSSDWDDIEQPVAHQITDSDFDENQATVVDDFDDMDSIIDENFDLASFDEGQLPEIPLTNFDSFNIATTLTPNRVSPIPAVSTSKPESKPESKSQFTDLSAPAIAAKDDFSEDILLEEALANDLLNQDYDLDVDPFEEALASDLLNGSGSSTLNELDNFVPTREPLPPPNPTSTSTFVMAPTNQDFLDDFDFDSIEIQDFSDKNKSGLPPISTGLNPSVPPIVPISRPEPTSSPAPNSFLPPPALPPLPPKRNQSQGRPASSIAQNNPIQSPNIQPIRGYADSIEEDSNFDGFHIQEDQNQFQNQNLARKSINSIDESWSDLLNAETVISGVLHSPPANMNANVAMPQRVGSTAGRNSQGRDGRDQASARNNFQRQPDNLPDFSDLGLEIHDDNTDWSGLLDSDEANDNITSISTQMPPMPRAQVDMSALNTSITGSGETREIPRDRRQPAPNYSDANQGRMGATPDQMSFNRFTEDNYDSYGSSQGATAQNRNKPQPKTSTLSLESLWQNYLKIPVIGIGAIGAAFLLYTVANKPIFDLGLRWGIFKDASGRDFKDADFRGVKLDNVNFTKATLTGAKMQNTSLAGANFYEANLDGVNFTNANLKSARLIRASVIWSEFKNAQMNLTDLAEADLTRSNFATAKMEGANLKDSKIGVQGTESAAIFTPTTLLAWQIVNEPKSNRNLADQNLVGLNLSFTSLKKANLSNANINFVDMTSTDLSGANLTGTQVNGINWSGANLTAINLTNVVFDKSKLPKTDETTTCPNGKKGPCKFL